MAVRRRGPDGCAPMRLLIGVLLGAILLGCSRPTRRASNATTSGMAAPPTDNGSPAASSLRAIASPRGEIWMELAARPLRLPDLAPGASCPHTAARQLDPAYGPLRGDGPIYAGVEDPAILYPRLR